MNDQPFMPTREQWENAQKTILELTKERNSTRQHLFTAVSELADAQDEILELEDELAKLREENQWISIKNRMPQTRQRVEIEIKNKSGKSFFTVADYIAPRTVLEEDFIDPEYHMSFVDYDEENDKYWTPSGFYESQLTSDVNWFIDPQDFEVVNWRPMPKSPESKGE